MKIEGDVETPFELTYGGVREMESRTTPLRWNAQAMGALFSRLRQRCAMGARRSQQCGVDRRPADRRAAPQGLNNTVREVIFEGADRARSRSRRDCRKNSLRAQRAAKEGERRCAARFKMNGEELTRAHGSPLRVIVPGWYGMASVKC